jgi:hypothetical protein
VYHAVLDWGLGNLVTRTVCGREQKIKPGSRRAVNLIPWGSCAKRDMCPLCQTKVDANYDGEAFATLMAVPNWDTRPAPNRMAAPGEPAGQKMEEDS